MSNKLNQDADNNPQFNDILLYTSPNGAVKIEVIYEGETFWLSQKKIAQLFNVSVPTINEHLQNIFQTGELEQVSTIRNFRIVQREGNRDVTREIDFYNLDVVIAVGYRVNSYQATQDGAWAGVAINEWLQGNPSLVSELPNNLKSQESNLEVSERLRQLSVALKKAQTGV